MARIDVTVRGAGVLGLACAWSLRGAGRAGAGDRSLGRRRGGKRGRRGRPLAARAGGLGRGQGRPARDPCGAEGFWARVGRRAAVDPGYARTRAADAGGRRQGAGGRAAAGGVGAGLCGAARRPGGWSAAPEGWGPVVGPRPGRARHAGGAGGTPAGRSRRWRRRSRARGGEVVREGAEEGRGDPRRPGSRAGAARA